MRTLQITIFFFFLYCPVIYGEKLIPHDLEVELNDVISQREEINARRSFRIDSLKQLEKRESSIEKQFRVACQIFKEYRYYQCDSALRYAQKVNFLAKKQADIKWENQSALWLGYVLSVAGLTKEAYDCLNAIDSTTLDKQQMLEYYVRMGQVYFTLNANAVGTSYSDEYYAKGMLYQSKLLQKVDINDLKSVEYLCRVWYSRDSYKQYKEVFLALIDKSRLYSHEYAMLNFQLAMAYSAEEDKKKMVESLTRSAIADLKLGVRDHYSLQLLATYLFQNGEIDAAYKYINVSHEDALFYDARQRTIDLARIYPQIKNAYLLKKEHARFIFIVTSSLLFVIALLLVLLIWFYKKQLVKITSARNELQLAYDRLDHLNHELEKSNQIKEEYIGQFLSLCSTYIEKIENYQKIVLRKIKYGQTDELIKSMNSNKYVEEELKEFYLRFDLSFLRLYPNFVQEFNALLLDDEQIVLKNNDLLNTELRIFALIRLGITDSSDIAHFLRYSPNSIYNYRARVKNKSKGDRDEFERRVSKIGSGGVL